MSIQVSFLHQMSSKITSRPEMFFLFQDGQEIVDLYSICILELSFLKLLITNSIADDPSSNMINIYIYIYTHTHTHTHTHINKTLLEAHLIHEVILHSFLQQN